jgi:hypothetical protein
LTTKQTLPAVQCLDLAARLALNVSGSFIEFGVAEGDSTRLLARIKGNRKLFACDSFEGLREKFENADWAHLPAKPQTSLESNW